MYDLCITQVALDAKATDDTRNVVQCKVGGGQFVLGSVQLGHLEQFPLRLTFDKGHPIVFTVHGTSSVHLTGNYAIDGKPATMITKQVPVESSKESETSTPVSKKQKTDIAKPEPKAQRVEVKTPSKTPSKRGLEPESPTTPETNTSMNGSPATTPKENKPKTPTTPKPKTATVQKLPNGLVIEDIMVGAGKLAQPGRKVTVNYVGKFPSGKKFDSGRNFSFRLGTEQVIKGWDIGVMGMKVGGRRQLTVPPSLGYGKAGAPPAIPPNAVLCFDVELTEC